MPKQLQFLQNNFSQLHSAAQKDLTAEPPLVANLWGTCVHDTSTHWGRLWRWIYGLLSCLGCTQIERNKLVQALQKTQKVFLEQQEIIQAHIKRYQFYLSETTKGQELDDTAYDVDRKAITEWNDKIVQFVQFFHENHSGLANLIDQVFTDSLEADIPFHTSALTDLQQCQYLIDLEGLFGDGDEIPWAVLNKLAKGIRVFNEEEQQLEEWIAQLKLLADDVDIHTFHYALKSFLEQVNGPKTPPEQIHKELAQLELKLMDNGCQLFLEGDADHLAWRASLKPGSVVKLNGEPYIIGEQIGKKLMGDDKNIIFSLPTLPASLMQIGINCALLGMKNYLQSTYKGIIPIVAFKELDREGRCALVEKLDTPLTCVPWTSKQTLSPQDKLYSHHLIELLKKMIKQNLSPQVPFAQYLHFQGDRYLVKSLRALPMATFNYTVIEDTVMTIAKKNHVVLRHIMQQSGLTSHPTAKYFKWVVNQAAEGLQADIKQRATFRNITDPNIVDKGKALYDEASQLKLKCCHAIQAQNGGVINKATITKVGKQFKTCYNQSLISGKLWPFLAHQVISKVR